MTEIAIVRPITLFQGQAGGIIHWRYVDIDTGVIVMPDDAELHLYNPSDEQKSPTNTANAATESFTPLFDTDGTVTGVEGSAYFTIGEMDSNAAVGLWYVNTTYSWESVPSDYNIGFNVAAGGAVIGGGEQLATVPVYAFHKDVENLLLTVKSFDRNSPAMADKIDNYIVMAEGEFERRTGTAFKPRFQSNEVLSLEAYRQSYIDQFFATSIFSKRPLILKHYPLLPFDPSRGHRLELYKGTESESSEADPLRRWDDFLELTYGRANDYWFDEEGAGVYIRNTFFVRRGRVMRITYEWGKPITTLTQPAFSEPTTIHVKSTHRYEYRGVIRIGRTYVFHTGKTPTSFTGCQWGVLGTQAEDYSSGAEVYEVPHDVRLAVTKRAAALFLQNERFIAFAGDNAGSAPDYSSVVESWNQDWEYFISNTYQRWNNF